MVLQSHHEWCLPRMGNQGRARFVVLLAGEVGGRFSSETGQFLWDLAKAKVREVPQLQKGRAHVAWIRRWSSMLACAAARAFAIFSLGRGLLCGIAHTVSARSAGDDRHAV